MATLNIPVTKAKAHLEVDLDQLPEAVYREALVQGLKVLLNRGASKVTASTIPNEEERKAEAMATAEAQLQLCYEGKIRFTGGKAKKASGAVMTEAMRIARNRIKDAMKEAGIKISHVKASEITAAAKQLLEDEPDLIKQAEAALVERSKVPVKIDIKALIHEDPELVAKAETKRKATLSAKQAGMVTKRAKPAAEARA